MSQSRELSTQELNIVEGFEQFYRDYYREEIGILADKFPSEQSSLYIEASDLYRFSQDLLEDWVANPDDLRPLAEQALSNYDLPVDIDLSAASVRLTDSDGYLPERSVTDVDSDDIGDLVAVSGQLARVSGKSPRLVTAAWECDREGAIHRIPQSRTEVQKPHQCKECERQGPFKLNIQESTFLDQRKVKLEEPIEERSQAQGEFIAVYVEGDLCDHGPAATTLPDHAGEQAKIIGEVNVDESQFSGRGTDPETDIWIDATAIVFEDDDAEDIDIEAHRDEFEALAERDDAVDLVAESLAPSLHADEEDDLYTARRACAAWIYNAYRVDPDGSGSKRGDLHMCLIGDPGTGKSSLMSYIDDVLPKSEFRTGTGLSEVGLTAAAVQEEFAGKTEWTLQPGILPRADGGHCIIDEIDGVVDENTKAIHDALEGEQMVKTDKAGIKADLPTRCALLAGGNPVYTRFDRYEPIAEQIDLDPALFDRMDLVFALQDTVDEQRDATKAEHALDAYDELSRQQVAEQTGGEADTDSDTVDPEVPKETLRAWVAYARRNVFPTLTPAAKERLKEFYVEVRDLNDGYGDDDGKSAVPATMRTLESGIRLSIAFARLRLSDTVAVEDAEQAITLSREVVGLNFDPDTGEFDADRQTRGGRSQEDRIETVYDIIDGERMPIDDIRDRAGEKGIGPSETDHAVETLAQKGEIYEPETEVYQTT